MLWTSALGGRIGAAIMFGAGLAAASSNPAHAAYRIGIDSSIQTIAFRGVALDSIPRDEVIERDDGSLWTPDGYAVVCRGSSDTCTYFRAGDDATVAPFITTVDVDAWDLGVRGLRVHARARLGTNAGEGDEWPSTLEGATIEDGYLEYRVGRLTARAGRLRDVTFLGPSAFDGGELAVALWKRRVEVSARGGWGLARAALVPATDDATDPLDDYRADRRQRVLGGRLAASLDRVQMRLEYEQEVDTRADDYVSDVGGLSLRVRGPADVIAYGDIEYDFVLGEWGSAEASITARPITAVHATAGARRVRPRIDWRTIWGAFSPVGYHAAFVRGGAVPHPDLTVSARGEWFEMEDVEALTPLVATESDGYRWEVAARGWSTRRVSAHLGMHREFGPGAGSIGGGGGVDVNLSPGWVVGFDVRTLDRPLELRFQDVSLTSYGMNARGRSGGVDVWTDVRYSREDRDRPDAAAIEWDRWRFALGVGTSFSSSGSGVPEAVWAIPEREVP